MTEPRLETIGVFSVEEVSIVLATAVTIANGDPNGVLSILTNALLTAADGYGIELETLLAGFRQIKKDASHEGETIQ